MGFSKECVRLSDQEDASDDSGGINIRWGKNYF